MFALYDVLPVFLGGINGTSMRRVQNILDILLRLYQTMVTMCQHAFRDLKEMMKLTSEPDEKHIWIDIPTCMSKVETQAQTIKTDTASVPVELWDQH